MANKVSYLIELQDRFSAVSSRVRSSVRGLGKGMDEMSRRVKNSDSKLMRLGKTAGKVGNALSSAGESMMKNITLPLAALGSYSLVQSAKLETLQVSFETMTGSAENAKNLMKDLTSFTATTPFQLAGVGKATKTLLAFKVPLKDMNGTLRMLGDIAAGTDAPLQDIAQIFGKARAKGKLMTEEILQLAERGIPIIDVLSEKFNITKQQVFEMASKSQISFKAMQMAMADMTSEGGIFFDQTRRQSATLGGLFSTLKDNLSLTAAVFGDIMVDVFGLKGGLVSVNEWFNNLRKGIQDFAKEHPVITKMIAYFMLFLAVLGPILFVAGKVAMAFSVMSIAAGVLGVSMSTILIPIIAISAAIALLVVAGVMVVKNWDGIKGGAIALWETIKGLFSKIPGLMKDIGASIMDFLLWPMQQALKAASWVAEQFGRELPESAKMMMNYSFASRNQTDVNVNLRAPEKTVESVKSSSSKSKGSNMNVGVNMETLGMMGM